jgi:tagatose-6-phosphate ketose/aldose isomerase
MLLVDGTPNDGAAEQEIAVHQLQQFAAVSAKQRLDAGYGHTLREILQQPDTWAHTARQLNSLIPRLKSVLEGVQAMVLTGSGSSEYAGESVRPAIQNGSGILTQVVGSGELLTHGAAALPPQRPLLLVSFARSGDSPESVGALAYIAELDPSIRHLVFTCNREGSLVTEYADDKQVTVVVLNDRTNDRSLVMTSSFTNMVLAALSLGHLEHPGFLVGHAGQLAGAGKQIVDLAFLQLHQLAQEAFHRVFYLASQPLIGTARESALKMVEMTAGRVLTVEMSYLGLRHGPMSGVDSRTLVVCFLSSDPLVRAYESDVIRELNDKKLGHKKLIVGCDIPAEIVAPGDVCIEHAGFKHDREIGVLYAMVGQVLAFQRSLAEGLRPDEPSEDGVINRVVKKFRLHSGSVAAD